MATEEVTNLETADASITTALVTIKALQVGRKQMTMSVFRQLPESPLVDEDSLELLGQPWGYVNYRWGDQRLHFAKNYSCKIGLFSGVSGFGSSAQGRLWSP